jgi:hypothetical protein
VQTQSHCQAANVQTLRELILVALVPSPADEEDVLAVAQSKTSDPMRAAGIDRCAIVSRG